MPEWIAAGSCFEAVANCLGLVAGLAVIVLLFGFAAVKLADRIDRW